MSILTWLRTPRLQTRIAASSIVLAAGGMVLLRSHAGAHTTAQASSNTISGRGVRGLLTLSNSRVLAGSEQRVFAELTLVADEAMAERERAPLSLVVVLDTSGSMQGDKIAQAKRSVSQLVRDMRPDDELALVRYADDSELVQPLAAVGKVRGAVIDKLESIEANGGTRIAPALSRGLRSLDEARRDRVRRIVLVSDGLDRNRDESEAIARDGAGRGVTISSMGIGLDFDEAYMSAVAQVGHGNFAFVHDARTLATFLQGELHESAATLVESATAVLTLPQGGRIVRVVGADFTPGEGREVSLHVGSLFAGDERRIALELALNLDAGQKVVLDGRLTFTRVGSGPSSSRLSRIEIEGTTDPALVEAGRDGAVHANAISALASMRQLEATRAYVAGDTARAQALIDQNLTEMKAIAETAPESERAMLDRQLEAYTQAKKGFSAEAPGSSAGKARAKASYARDSGNLVRKKF